MEAEDLPKVMVIAGVGSGISKAVAKKFGKQGFVLALLARSEDKLLALKDELVNEGIQSEVYPIDLSDVTLLRVIFSKIRIDLGEPSVLVYNASAFRKGTPLKSSFETLVDDFKVNVAAALTCSREVHPGMESIDNGTIIFTGGGLAQSPYMDFTSLSIGKAGLRNLAICLGQELFNSNIRVHSVQIRGMVSDADSRYNSKAIADLYWKIHSEPKGKYEVEVIY
jgi:short-subunit dehydrogenase